MYVLSLLKLHLIAIAISWVSKVIIHRSSLFLYYKQYDKLNVVLAIHTYMPSGINTCNNKWSTKGDPFNAYWITYVFLYLYIYVALNIYRGCGSTHPNSHFCIFELEIYSSLCKHWTVKIRKIFIHVVCFIPPNVGSFFDMKTKKPHKVSLKLQNNFLYWYKHLLHTERRRKANNI